MDDSSSPIDASAIDPITKKAVDRIRLLSEVSDDRDCLTRTFQSGAMRRAMIMIGSWMRDLGMEFGQDRAGTLIGRFPAAEPTGEVLLMGSHVDTVRNAGAYDGALGVIVALAAIEDLRRQGRKLRYNVDVIAFADEEGVRFQTTFLASSYFVGRFPKEDLELRDADGVTLGEALGALAVEQPHAGYGDDDEMLGYLECHIEQGKELEKQGCPLGIVSGIVGQTRARVRVFGKSAHAGATNMEERRDALVGAAEFVLLCESLAKRSDGLVATVGNVTIENPASNTIPGEVACTVDVRHGDDARREEFCQTLEQTAREKLEQRGLGFELVTVSQSPAATCSTKLNDVLSEVIKTKQDDCPVIESLSGHDAVSMAQVMDASMIFVRCRDGLSHHPDEFVSQPDIAAAIAAVTDFLIRMDESDAN